MYAVSVFLFLTVQVGAQYSASLPYHDISVTNVNGIASFTGAPMSGEPGHPLLPAYTVTFLLPPDVDLSSVKATIENQSEKELDGTFDVKPALPPTTRGEIVWPANRRIVDGKNIDIYERNAFFPADYSGGVQFGAMRNYKLAEFTVFPYRYNPVTRKLRTITGGTIKFSLPSTDSTILRIPMKNTPEGTVEKWLKSKVVNPQSLQDYGVQSQAKSLLNSAVPAVSGTYAIITTNAIINGSSQISNLIAQKQQKGFTVITVTENTWGGGAGDGAANNIRNWLRNNYLSQNIRYVLLIGNPDPTYGDVPMKMCWPRYSDIDYREAPTDYFYAELSGNWDINNDSYFGSYDDFYLTGGPDRFAEVAVGRIPSYNGDMTTLNKIIQKIIRYENETAVEWRRFAMIPMEPSSDITPGFELGEQVKTDFLVPKSIKSYRLYDKFNSDAGAIVSGVMTLNPPPESPECSETRVLDAWKNNDFGLVTWFTHGWSQGASGVFSSSNAAYLDDMHPSIVYEASCNNATPEESTNLAYSLLSNGAVATIAATRVSWYLPGQTYFAGEPSNQGFLYSFVQNLVRDSMDVASALNTVKSNTSFYGSAYWMNYLDYNVYGCPDIALNLKPSVINAPTNLTATAVSSSQINISWTDNSSNETGFRIERASYNGTFAQIATVGPNVTSFQNTGLSVGQVYRYRVRAYTSTENSLYSNVTSTFTAGGQTIVSPSGVTVQSISSGQLQLSWNQVSGASSYNLYVSSTSGGPYALAVSECTETLRHFNLTPGQTFYFVVTTVTPNGESPYSAQVSAAAPVVPPTSLYAEALSSYDVRIDFWYWANLSQRDGVTIDVEYTTNGTFTFFDYTYAANGSNSYYAYNLQPGTTYQFRMRAKKGTLYSVYSNIVSVTTAPFDPPQTPSNLIATQVSGFSVTLSWTDNSTNEIGFIIERAQSPEDFTFLDYASQDQTSYQDNNVTAGSSYNYRVVAYNHAGYSDYSNSISVTAVTPLYRINCGDNSAAFPFTADQYANGGTIRTVTNGIDMSSVTNPAPQAVYQSERYGNSTYTIPNLTAGGQYRVRLHFAELYQTAVGQRVFNVAINGSTVLSNFDIYAVTGARYKATVREFTAPANSSGQIVINFNTITDNATISGIEILPIIYQLSSGSSSAVSSYTADQYVSGGTMRTVTNTIDMSGVANPAPQAVYQSERYGNSTYTFPNLTAGAQYTVRLHFAELYHTAAGSRRFNVLINTATVLSNFDIYAATGARYKATVREFSTTANSYGQIVINLNTVTDNATVEGIEIIQK